MNRRAASTALAAALLSALLGAGCATRPPLDPATPWTSGRLSVHVDAFGDKPASGVSADFDLRGDGERGELRLSSPLGALLAVARWSRAEAVLDTGRGETRYASLDDLAREAFGEALPLRAFPDWLAGRPWSGAPSRPTDRGFDQLDWQVSLARLSDGWVEAVRPSVPAVSVRARVEKAP